MTSRVNQFAPWASGSNAFALQPQDYIALPARDLGFNSGQVNKFQFNAVLRQSTTVAAMIGQFIVQRAQVDALDNGDISTLEENFEAALAAYINTLNLSQEQVAGAVTNILNSLTVVGGKIETKTSTTTWVCPDNTHIVELTGCAGGAGGGAGNGYAGAGGIGGNGFFGTFRVTPGAIYDCIIGSPGAQGVGGQPGGNGGNTTFGPRGGQVLAVALGGTGGESGGNPAHNYTGITSQPPGRSNIAFPNGGVEYIGGFAQNGIALGPYFIGGMGGGSFLSPPAPSPYGVGHFDAYNYGGGGSGGAGGDPGGAGGPGILILRY